MVAVFGRVAAGSLQLAAGCGCASASRIWIGFGGCLAFGGTKGNGTISIGCFNRFSASDSRYMWMCFASLKKRSGVMGSNRCRYGGGKCLLQS